MGMLEQYESFRPAAQAKDREDRWCVLVGHEAKFEAVFKRLESLEASDLEKRLEIGRLLSENEELKATIAADKAKMENWLAIRFKEVKSMIDKVPEKVGT